MMRGGAAINESLQDKYALLLVRGGAEMAGGLIEPPSLISHIHQTRKKKMKVNSG